MAGKYELYKDKAGTPPEAGNGEVIATSESYSSKTAAQKGIESVKSSAGSDVVDLTGP
jgi:uncharacterized protein YegP (UPF0339 family)